MKPISSNAIAKYINTWISHIDRGARARFHDGAGSQGTRYHVHSNGSHISFWPKFVERQTPHLLAKLGLVQQVDGKNGWRPVLPRLRDSGFTLAADWQDSIWKPAATKPLASPSLIGCTGSEKLITTILSDDGTPAFIVKSGRDLNSLCQELFTLQELRGHAFSPDALVRQAIEQKEEGLYATIQTWLDGVPLSSLYNKPDIKPALLETLQKLINPRIPISAKSLAADLVEFSNGPSFTPLERNRLGLLLRCVQDTRLLPASRLHGDVREQNILVQPQHDGGSRIGLVDWEFSSTPSLGILDWIQFIMSKPYGMAKSFEAWLSAEARQELDCLPTTGLPGCDIPLNQLLALQFATQYCTRIARFRRGSSPRMKNLETILNSPCTLSWA